ncbi:MAG: YncE family protein [Sphingobium sp.]|nr:YncE family protein [Sphingobium sp.]
MRNKLILSLTALLMTAAAPNAPTYTVSGSITGPDGSWDYARVDAGAHKLYVARSNAITVVDLPSGTATTMGELKRGHAVVPLGGGRLLATSGTDGTVRFFNEADGKEISSIAVGKKPDAAILDASGKRAFVMNSDSGTVSVIDTTTMRVVRTLTAKPALEYAALVGNTLFVNDEDLNELETIDVVTGKLGKAIALKGCEGPTGLGYDSKNARLISSCANGKAAVVDAKTQKLVALVDIGKGPDAVIVDEARGLAFIPCGGDGVLDILSLASPKAVTRVGRVTTEVGARTGALDPTTGIVYLPTAKFGQPAQAGGRPGPVAGSFHILVVKPS